MLYGAAEYGHTFRLLQLSLNYRRRIKLFFPTNSKTGIHLGSKNSSLTRT